MFQVETQLELRYGMSLLGKQWGWAWLTAEMASRRHAQRGGYSSIFLLDFPVICVLSLAVHQGSDCPIQSIQVCH